MLLHNKLWICYLQSGLHSKFIRSQIIRTVNVYRKLWFYTTDALWTNSISNCSVKSTKGRVDQFKATTVASGEWSHHHRKHAILFDKVWQLHHTLDNSSIVSSNSHFRCLVSCSCHSICTQSLQTCHSTLHQSLGVAEPLQIIPSLLHKHNQTHLSIKARKHIHPFSLGLIPVSLIKRWRRKKKKSTASRNISNISGKNLELQNTLNN